VQSEQSSTLVEETHKENIIGRPSVLAVMFVLGCILLVVDVYSDWFHRVVISGRKLEMVSILFDISDIVTASGLLEQCDIFPAQICVQAFGKVAVALKGSRVVFDVGQGPSVARLH
jgi:hypothetical protein